MLCYVYSWPTWRASVGARAQPGPAGAGRVVKRGKEAEDHGIGN